MPWSIESKDGEFCVVKDANGKVEGCHATQAEAKAQLAALNAAENKAANYIKANGLGLPTSFEELDGMLSDFRMGEMLNEMLSNYSFLINNVLSDGYEGRKTFDDIQNVTEQFLSRLGDLKDMVPPDSTKDNEASSEFKDAADEVANLPDDTTSTKDASIVTTPVNEDSGVFIYKDNIGTYRWIARYSNNIRDEDNPSEIISAKSHKRFDELVKSGIIEPPELWIWHQPEWCIGKADWVALDEVKGFTFTVAGGTIHPKFQHLATKLSAQTKDMLVSHGMPKWSVKRDKEDASIIVEHVTKEISLLPSWAAANPFTGIVISKEHDMAFSATDKARLMEKHNVSADLLEEIAQLNLGDVEKAAELELETKEANDAQVEAEVVETTDEPAEVTEVVEETEPQASADDNVLPQEVFTSLEAIMKSVMVLNEKFDKEINHLKSKIDELEQTEENRVAVKAATSPLASLTSMMVSSVIGEDLTRVDGRTTLAKSKPVEEPAGKQHTGIPMIDGFINGNSSR